MQGFTLNKNKNKKTITSGNVWGPCYYTPHCSLSCCCCGAGFNPVTEFHPGAQGNKLRQSMRGPYLIRIRNQTSWGEFICALLALSAIT